METRIVAAALKVAGLTITAEPPARHHTLLHAFHALHPGRIVGPDEQGFLSSQGEFVSRRRAAGIALDAGQIQKLNWPPELFSEDLW